jgi:plastocyanin
LDKRGLVSGGGVFRAAAAATLLCLLAACGGGDDSGPQERTVRVDYSHDEFPSSFLKYFPREVTLRPGDTAVFKQTWTGEPHSVTMGTLVNDLMKVVEPYIEGAEKGEPIPDEEPPEVTEASKPLPFMFGEEINDVAQNAAQPCFLDSGAPPTDPNTACPKRSQPDFNGKQSYYNSGFIPYEGSAGNEFKVPLADDITPGSYFFYCNYHGPLMSGKINVVGNDGSIPSEDEVNKAAREEIDKQAAPLREQLEKAEKGSIEVPPDQRDVFRNAGFLKPGTNRFMGNLAGLYAEDESVMGGINGFIPKELTVRTGEKVKWVNLGMHTISFNVPKYFPVISVEKDGTVVYNPKVITPAGGVPEHPEPFDFEGPPPKEPRRIDGGTWNGKGFYSTGLIGWDPFVEFSMAFSEKGTYKYACLIHPPMTGTVVVK